MLKAQMLPHPAIDTCFREDPIKLFLQPASYLPRLTQTLLVQVIQKFDHSKFHFKKAYDNEVLFQFEQLGRGDGPVTFQESSTVTSNSDLVLINVSPIEYGHVLLVPRVLDDLPQLADPASTLLALRFCQQADNPFFRLCYNSLGAYATINHLHFQVCPCPQLRQLFSAHSSATHAVATAAESQDLLSAIDTVCCSVQPGSLYAPAMILQRDDA